MRRLANIPCEYSDIQRSVSTHELNLLIVVHDYAAFISDWICLFWWFTNVIVRDLYPTAVSHKHFF